jgi:hypothetical protein
MQNYIMTVYILLFATVAISNISAEEAYSDPKGTYLHGVAKIPNIQGDREGKYDCYSSRPVGMYVLYPYMQGKSIQWETPHFTAGKHKTYFDIPIGFGTGWLRDTMKADYDLFIDGKKYVTLSCTAAAKQVWQGLEGVRLTYYAIHKDAVNEPHGRMLLELPAGFQHEESYLTIRITPSKGSAGNAWLMIHHKALYAGNDIEYWLKNGNFHTK